MQISIKHIDQIKEAANNILAYADDEKKFLFYGEMGAGKTTLIKEICEELGTLDHTSSPTFSIVNEYQIKNGLIFHFDFYRLKDEIEAFDIGFEDYLYSGNYCFIEWPEKISGLIPENYLKVNIMTIGKNERSIKLEKI